MGSPPPPTALALVVFPKALQAKIGNEFGGAKINFKDYEITLILSSWEKTEGGPQLLIVNPLIPRPPAPPLPFVSQPF